jgi:hypothetical protein
MLNLVDRAKKIILAPKAEWVVIDQEDTSIRTLVVNYLIPLALIPTVAVFIRYGLVGYGIFGPSIPWGIKQALVTFLTTVGGAFITAYLLEMLSPFFVSARDFRKAMQLVVYSYTPMMIVGVFQIIPGLGFFSILGIYGLYLLYAGLKPLLKTPDDKVFPYLVASLIVLVGVYLLLGLILAALFIGNAYNTMLIQ